MGSAETLYELKIKKKIGSQQVESKIKSTLELENPDEPNPGKWVFREGYVKINKEYEISINNSGTTFLGSDIISGSIRKSADPSLTKAFGSHKGLDTISVQEYMYALALRKLNINRQFENAIKEIAIDCNLNKYGNIVRLNEFYTPSSIENIYNLEYENYSNGDSFIRQGQTQFSLQQIIDGIAKNIKSFDFINKRTNETLKLNKSLVLLENINCENKDYSFSQVPEKIVNLTLNKELIPQLMKLKIKDIRQYFYDVQTGIVKPKDLELSKKLNKFLSKDENFQKEEIIKRFLDMGIGEESVWELYPLEQLKKEYALFKFKK